MSINIMSVHLIIYMHINEVYSLFRSLMYLLVEFEMVRATKPLYCNCYQHFNPKGCHSSNRNLFNFPLGFFLGCKMLIKHNRFLGNKPKERGGFQYVTILWRGVGVRGVFLVLVCSTPLPCITTRGK